VTLANWRTAPFNEWAFHHVSEVVPSAVIKHDATKVKQFGTDSNLALPDIQFDGKKVTSDEFLQHSHTDGLVVLHNNELLHETYRNGMTVSDPHILMSVSKSMLGLLVGVLVDQGMLDLNASVESYLPELRSSAFAGATLQNLLDMRTGIGFDEDYLATEGQIIEYRKATNWNPIEPGDSATDLRSFFSTITAVDRPHGGVFDYKSPCTDLIGWVIERAAGKPYGELFSEYIWATIGAEYPAMVTVDRLGAPRVAGGMSMTTRDLARIGKLMVDDGAGIIPKGWIEDIETNGDPDAWDKGSFTEYFPGMSMHYRSKWYVIRGESPILFCLGIHGQNLFVDRKAKLVMARYASGPEPLDITSDLMALEIFRELLRTV
jgi:CubicO group peptidase (beta-lactamase class C family)